MGFLKNSNLSSLGNTPVIPLMTPVDFADGSSTSTEQRIVTAQILQQFLEEKRDEITFIPVSELTTPSKNAVSSWALTHSKTFTYVTWNGTNDSSIEPTHVIWIDDTGNALIVVSPDNNPITSFVISILNKPVINISKNIEALEINPTDVIIISNDIYTETDNNSIELIDIESVWTKANTGNFDINIKFKYLSMGNIKLRWKKM